MTERGHFDVEELALLYRLARTLLHASARAGVDSGDGEAADRSRIGSYGGREPRAAEILGIRREGLRIKLQRGGSSDGS